MKFYAGKRYVAYRLTGGSPWQVYDKAAQKYLPTTYENKKAADTAAAEMNK